MKYVVYVKGKYIRRELIEPSSFVDRIIVSMIIVPMCIFYDLAVRLQDYLRPVVVPVTRWTIRIFERIWARLCPKTFGDEIVLWAALISLGLLATSF